MNNAFYIGATGMHAQQLNVDTIANNLANVNTNGFKKSRVIFSDLMTEAFKPIQSDLSLQAPSQLQNADGSGGGIGVAQLARIFDAGELKRTDAPFDIAIQGRGFLEVTLPDGSSAYMRGGALKINRDGQLATQSGYPLKPGITLPDNVQKLTINSDGRVQISTADRAVPIDIAQLELVRFANPEALTALGGDLYLPTDAAGEATTAKPGEEGAGTLAQGFIEASNVKLIDEMVNLMVAQRAYEASAKLVQTSDDLQGIVNNLRK